VKVGEIIKGQCVEHEVDVVAENEKEIIMVECKFHRQQGRKSDVKVTLYIKSRFDDIRSQLEKDGRLKNKTFQGVVATNTRFTDDARQYGICSGLKLLSWDFPSNNNLQTWVEDSNYHVITALSSANKKTKEILLENDIVLCREILEQKEKMLKIGIPESLIQKITKEAEAILK
jgi:arsenate reductase-like glutaredoxin family protein